MSILKYLGGTLPRKTIFKTNKLDTHLNFAVWRTKY